MVTMLLLLLPVYMAEADVISAPYETFFVGQNASLHELRLGHTELIFKPW